MGPVSVVVIIKQRVVVGRPSSGAVADNKGMSGPIASCLRGREADTFWVWVAVLGFLFCSRGAKQTAADEMDPPVGVALKWRLKTGELN